MERDLLVQALIIVIVANTLVIGLAVVGGRTGRRRVRATRAAATAPGAPSLTATNAPPLARAAPAATPAVGAPTASAPSATTTPSASADPDDRPVGATGTLGVVPPSRAADGGGPRGWVELSELAELAELESGAGWHRAVRHEVHRWDRSAGAVAAIALEARGYAALEERFGRGAASAVSEPLAMTVRALSRRADVVALVGPASYRVLLLDGDPEAATAYVERVRRAVDPWLAAGGLTLRLSVGHAVVPAEGGIEEAIRLSEQRMYQDAHRR